MNDRATTTCPEPAVLSEYSNGSLPLEEFERVEKHVAACCHCIEVLEELDTPVEPIVATLREHDLWRCEEAGYRNLRKRIENDLPVEMPATSLSGVGDPPLDVLPSSSMLGNYRLAERVGHGAMGVVYRAEHAKLKRWVAVKILTAPRRGAAAAVKQFELEMQILGQLEEHENIVRARDAGQSGDHHFLVMDYVDGVNVSQLLSRFGPLEVSDACEIIRQAALALAHAHRHGLVHRDVKPNNLMVTREGCVKLLDLGLASYHDAPSEAIGIAGTADYLAPEAWKSSAVGPSVDVYGLGCTLFKLLVGYAPFARGETSNEAKQRRHLTEQPEAVDALRKDVPHRLARLVAAMLEKDPEVRIESAAHVAQQVAPMALGQNLRGLIANSEAAESDTDQFGDAPTMPLMGPLPSPDRRSLQRGRRNGRPNTRQMTRRAWAVGAAAAGAAAWWGWMTERVEYELLWSYAPDGVFWQYQSDRKLLRVQATDLALIVESPAEERSGVLGAYITPQGPQTHAGFFYAYQLVANEGWTTRTFRTIGFSTDDAGGQRIVLMQHRINRTPAGTSFDTEQLIAEQRVAAADARRSGGPLIVSIREGHLQSATFQGRRLEELEAIAASSDLEDVPPSPTGLFLSNGAATFRKARLHAGSA